MPKSSISSAMAPRIRAAAPPRARSSAAPGQACGSALRRSRKATRSAKSAASSREQSRSRARAIGFIADRRKRRDAAPTPLPRPAGKPIHVAILASCASAPRCRKFERRPEPGVRNPARTQGAADFGQSLGHVRQPPGQWSGRLFAARGYDASPLSPGDLGTTYAQVLGDRQRIVSRECSVFLTRMADQYLARMISES